MVLSAGGEVTGHSASEVVTVLSSLASALTWVASLTGGMGESVCLSVCLSVSLSVRPSVRPSARPPARPPACLSVCLSVCPPVSLSVCLSVFVSVFSSAFLFIRLSVRQCVRLSVPPSCHPCRNKTIGFTVLETAVLQSGLASYITFFKTEESIQLKTKQLIKKVEIVCHL